MRRRVIFNNKGLPYLLLLPQIIVTWVFFFWPGGQAIYQSMLVQDPFGLNSRFVWFENFTVILGNPLYLNAVTNTLIFSLSVTFSSMSAALGLAVLADRPIRFAVAYKTLLMWPYAVAPAEAALPRLFVLHPPGGLIRQVAGNGSIPWDCKPEGRE